MYCNGKNLQAFRNLFIVFMLIFSLNVYLCSNILRKLQITTKINLCNWKCSSIFTKYLGEVFCRQTLFTIMKDSREMFELERVNTFDIYILYHWKCEILINSILWGVDLFGESQMLQFGVCVHLVFMLSFCTCKI